MIKIYTYNYGTRKRLYHYIIIEKRAFEDCKIIKEGTCMQNGFDRLFENYTTNVYNYTRKKDYTETVKILKTLVDSAIDNKIKERA